jgi:glyoxylase-like metal-dependent hydrolase (beta-lactamase superfamily II)
LKHFFAALILVVGALPAISQPRIDFATAQLQPHKIADDFYTIEGPGGTMCVLVTPDGLLVVDSEYIQLADKTVAAVKQISDKPVRFLVNTHVHVDHTGGNDAFGKLGAVIFARDQLRQRLMHPSSIPSGAPRTPAPPDALPRVTYDGPVTIHLGDEDIQLIPVRAAHTDGDTLIRFVHHDILATGDYFRTVGYPRMDLVNGGSLAGLLDGLALTIAEAGPNTRIVPGHGVMADRAAVIAQRDMLLSIRQKVADLVAQGKTVEEVIAAKPTAEYDAKVPEGAQGAEAFVKSLYAEVKSNPR